MSTKAELEALRLMLKGSLSESTENEQVEFKRCHDAITQLLDTLPEEMGGVALLFVMTERYSKLLVA
jgi:hypothetical protein